MGGVGDFIHDRLRVPESEVSQDDIETVAKLADQAAGSVNNETLVTFYSPETRDNVMMHANNLAGQVDNSGLPYAGVRLEVPPKLVDTFCLLSRFGTGLRARHGEGTKRHIKFDGYNESLFTVIKLPGDDHWTRVTPAMARKNLQASFGKEQEAVQQRLATKLLPGPWDRQSRGMGLRLASDPGNAVESLGSLRQHRVKYRTG